MVILPKVNLRNIEKFIEDIIDTPYLLSLFYKNNLIVGQEVGSERYLSFNIYKI